MGASAVFTKVAIPFALSCLALANIAQGQELPVDVETSVSGVDVACTGVGDEANSDPRWPEYSVRIEFAGPGGEYLADLDLAVSDSRGKLVLSAHCNGPWFLARLEPGRYEIQATSTSGLSRSARFTSPSHGQSRTIVRFH